MAKLKGTHRSCQNNVNNRNTSRTRCEICSKLTINTQEQRDWCYLNERLVIRDSRVTFKLSQANIFQETKKS